MLLFQDEDQTPYLPSTVTVVPPSSSSKRQRCRDYDEKGFCMRGDQVSCTLSSRPKFALVTAACTLE